MEISLHGIAVSPGIAIGPALPFGVQSLDIPKYPIQDKQAEITRYEKAVDAYRKDLERTRAQTAEQLGETHAGIFGAHLTILEDVALREEIESRLESEAVNVEFLLDDVMGRYSKTLQAVEDPLFKERARDVMDVGTRILGKLLNTELEGLDHLARPSVIVAHDLSPSHMANLDLVNALGLAIDVGGHTSHTAILARAQAIPAVVGLRHVGQHTLTGDVIVVDGTRGRVVIRPTEETLAEFTETKRREESERRALLVAEKDQLSVTLDGYDIPTMVNIELPSEITQSHEVKAEGVGLYRTEYLFLNRLSLPTEDEQFEAYSQVAEAVKPDPVTLRTLDLGGDKFVSHLQLAEEINPQLGWRAIRFCLERPDIFKAQLRAMFRASVHGNVQVMFPLISGVEEFKRVKEVVREVQADLQRRAVAFDRDVKIGTMIEVPSAVTIADLLAEYSDFFSIGTNDLIQYSLAVDRVNEKIAHMYEPAHPAVLRMIQQTTKAAKAARIPCGICGEMAGDPKYTELLIGLGVDSLSMSSVAIPLVRAQVATVRVPNARRFAKKLLGMGSVPEIKIELAKRLRRRRALQRYLEVIDVAENQEEDS